MASPAEPARSGSAPFDHYLLTRFSAAFTPGEPAQEEWLRYRLGFFVDACWSSVLGQQDASDFTWLVLFDDRCSDDFRADVESLAAGAFTPIWSHDPWSPSIFARAIEARREGSEGTGGTGGTGGAGGAGGTGGTGGAVAPWLLTTRLDSDDGIARDFMAAVQREFTPTDGLFVDFPRGIQIDRSGNTYLYDQLSSPFLTLVEQRHEGRQPQTVYAARHARASAWGPVREVSAPPMWVQVIHGSNLLNMTVGARVSPRVVNERFELALVYDQDVPPLSLLRQKAVHRLRLMGVWWRHPGEATKWAEAKFWRLRGTHVRPRGSGLNLTESLKAKLVRRGWRPR